MLGWWGVNSPVVGVGVAVLRRPTGTGKQLGVADHVEQRHAADDRVQQIWPLRKDGPDEQAAVAAAASAVSVVAVPCSTTTVTTSTSTTVTTVTTVTTTTTVTGRGRGSCRPSFKTA